MNEDETVRALQGALGADRPVSRPVSLPDGTTTYEYTFTPGQQDDDDAENAESPDETELLADMLGRVKRERKRLKAQLSMLKVLADNLTEIDQLVSGHYTAPVGQIVGSLRLAIVDLDEWRASKLWKRLTTGQKQSVKAAKRMLQALLSAHEAVQRSGVVPQKAEGEEEEDDGE